MNLSLNLSEGFNRSELQTLNFQTISLINSLQLQRVEPGHQKPSEYEILKYFKVAHCSLGLKQQQINNSAAQTEGLQGASREKKM